MAKPTDYVVIVGTLLAMVFALLAAMYSNTAYNFAGGASPPPNTDAMSAASAAQSAATAAIVCALIGLIAGVVGIFQDRNKAKKPQMAPSSEPAGPYVQPQYATQLSPGSITSSTPFPAPPPPRQCPTCGFPLRVANNLYWCDRCSAYRQV